jgi:N-acetylmuramoyl-L-alanine amidase
MTPIQRPSPNYSLRAAPVDHLILHNTAGGLDGSLSWLCNPASQVSAHYMVARDGAVYQLVPEDRTAWHAGSRAWNHRSIGIEIVAKAVDHGMEEAQEDALVELMQDVMRRHKIPVELVLPHRAVRKGGTACPGLIWRTDADLAAWLGANFKTEADNAHS